MSRKPHTKRSKNDAGNYTTIGEAIAAPAVGTSRNKEDRTALLQAFEPRQRIPLKVTLEGQTKPTTNRFDGLPALVYRTIMANKAIVVSPQRTSKGQQAMFKSATIPLADGSVYELTLSYPVCWVRAPGDSERCHVWAMRETSKLVSAGHSGEYLQIPRSRAGQKAWVPKSREHGKTQVRDAFKAYPIVTDALIEFLKSELSFTVSPLQGHERSASSWLLLCEHDYATENWVNDREHPNPFQWHWTDTPSVAEEEEEE